MAYGGGKVEREEEYAQAALREIYEEVQLTPSFFLGSTLGEYFFEAKSNQIHHIPAFAAKASNSFIPALDDEHTQHKWIQKSEITTTYFGQNNRDS